MRIGDKGSVGFHNDTRTMTLTSGVDVNGGSSEPLGDFTESWRKHVYFTALSAGARPRRCSSR